MSDTSILGSYKIGALTDNAERENLLDGTTAAYDDEGNDTTAFYNVKQSARTDMEGDLTDAANPIVAFARLAAFFAGQQSFAMELKLKEYEEQHEFYQEVLENSTIAHQYKLKAAEADTDVGIEEEDDMRSFNKFMNSNVVTLSDDDRSNRLVHLGYRLGGGVDSSNDNLHSKEDWEGFCEQIDQKKDMESTTLNKLSTEMDLAVKDSDSAQEMAANAIKKANDLMSTQGKTSGG
ncbi:hypothetical protein [Desulfospira joergensenii]|uniref:hypothetical protein n=1 Tax=Desulfospira joergensenii TaxID=53329 RepID=UPI0003B5B946|nr:hypothetical protein [Desulfospira joergensenii]